MGDSEGFQIWEASDEFDALWNGDKALAGTKRRAPPAARKTEHAAAKRRAAPPDRLPGPSLNLSASTAGLQALASTANSQANRAKPTQIESLGADPDDVKRRLANASCVCKGSCHKAVKLKPLILLCQLFWSLSSVERGMLIRHEYMAAVAPEEDQNGTLSGEQLRKASWSLCGQAVCFPIFCSLLRTGEKTVRKYIAGALDGRKSVLGGEHSPAPRNHERSDQVDWFFQELYQSAAEPLPEDARCSWAAAMGQEDPSSQFDSPWSEAEQSGSLAVSGSGFKASGIEDDHVPQLTLNPVVCCTLACVAGVVGLPVRYLQHVRLMDLYWQFISAWDEQHSTGFLSFTSPPCFKTFTRRWKVWNKWLKIRKPSQHAQCQTCFDLQQVMNSMRSTWGQKMQAARDLRAHYRLQYQDRCIYWSMRFMSKAYKDVLTIIIDGMDKAKFAWPHWPFDRVSKGIEKIIRPKVVLTAAIAHGWCTCLFMTPEFVNHGSSLFSELICQTLEKVWDISKKTGRKFPRHLVIVADNTNAWMKNQFGVKLASMFVAAYKFLSVNLFFLIVGHTHEDVDQLFAVVLWLMLRQKTWETPTEILKVIADGLRDRIQDRGEVFLAVELTAVRNFKAWLDQLGVSTDNCYKNRNGVETPHSFTLKMGCCLTAEEKRMMLTLPGTPPVQPNSVYCCVKAYLRSTQLQQPPELQIPAERVQRLLSQSPQGILQRDLLESELLSAIKLKAICAELNLTNAAAALHDLVHSRRYFLPNLTWLESFQQHDLVDVASSRTMNPYYPHLPESSWKMVTKLSR